MKGSIDLSGTKFRDKERRVAATFCEALRDATDENIQSITLYGSAVRDDYRPGESDINMLVVLEHIDVTVLKSVINAVAGGRRHRIAPFFITERNLRSSADVFPVKFMGMQESYQVLVGRDVLGDLKISREHLRLRCEQEIKNLLLRLRRHYVMGGGRKLREMMSYMIVGFLENLRIVLSLDQDGLPSREKVVDAAANKFGFEAEILRKVRTLRDKSKPLSKKEAEQLYDQFMSIVDRVAQVTDQMK